MARFAGARFEVAVGAWNLFCARINATTFNEEQSGRAGEALVLCWAGASQAARVAQGAEAAGIGVHVGGTLSDAGVDEEELAGGASGTLLISIEEALGAGVAASLAVAGENISIEAGGTLLDASLVGSDVIVLCHIALATGGGVSAGNAVADAGRAGAGGDVVEKPGRTHAETHVLEEEVVGLAIRALVESRTRALGTEVEARDALGFGLIHVVEPGAFRDPLHALTVVGYETSRFAGDAFASFEERPARAHLVAGHSVLVIGVHE